MGLIRLYAEHWDPFSLTQTPASDVYGSVVTDPSYLYHYVMSFPYRLLSALIDNESVVIVLLRLLNIALFAWALVLYRKVLLKANVSPAITHGVLGVFVLIPVVPLLAGQVNYDNLFMLIIAALLLVAIHVREALHAQRLPVVATVGLVMLLLYGSTVKYAFLPIGIGIVAYLAYLLWRERQHFRSMATAFVREATKLPLGIKILCVVGVSIGIVLCGQRYVTNIVKYHDPVPDCGVVLNETRCQAYGPWGRDYRYAHNKQGLAPKGPILYTAQDWSWGMWNRLFFTLAGPTNDYATRKPLPVIAYGAIVVAAIGVLLSLRYSRSILRRYPVFWLFFIVSTLYIAALWLQVYQSQVYTARPVAINGRYLLPFLPLLGAFAAIAYQTFLKNIGKSQLQALGVIVVLLVFLQGGSAITYIVRSEPAWFWNVKVIRDVNNAAKEGLRPLIIGG